LNAGGNPDGFSLRVFSLLSSGFLREVFGKASGIPEAFPNTSPILPEENMPATAAKRIRKAKRLSGQKRG